MDLDGREELWKQNNDCKDALSSIIIIQVPGARKPVESHDKDFTGVVKDPGIEVTQPRASLKGTLRDIDSP